MVFEQQDYILRLIALAGEAIRRALEQMRVGHNAQALRTVDEAIGCVLDTDPELILRLTPDGLVTFLGIGTLADDRRLELLAEALEVRAQILRSLERADEAELDDRRAAAVRLMVTQSSETEALG